MAEKWNILLRKRIDPIISFFNPIISFFNRNKDILDFEKLDYKDEIEILFQEFKNNQYLKKDYISKHYIEKSEKTIREGSIFSSRYDPDTDENKEIRRKYKSAVNFLSLYNLIVIDSKSLPKRVDKFYEAAIFKTFEDWYNFLNRKIKRESRLLWSSNISNYVTGIFSFLTFCALALQIILNNNNNSINELKGINKGIQTLDSIKKEIYYLNKQLDEITTKKLDSVK